MRRIARSTHCHGRQRADWTRWLCCRLLYRCTGYKQVWSFPCLIYVSHSIQPGPRCCFNFVHCLRISVKFLSSVHAYIYLDNWTKFMHV